jgi:predicted Zn-dependent peptidase
MFFYKKIDSISNLASKYAIAGEYDKIMSQLGEKGLNAGTHNDYTVYTVEIPSNELPRFLELEGIRFKQIVNRLFHTELEAVYEEKNSALDNDNRKIYEDLLKNLFPTHPYGNQSVLGTIEHLKNPSITEIKKYFEVYYRPNNMSISISGEIDYNETIKLIDKNFGKLLPNDNLPVWEKIVEKPIKKIIRSEVYGPTEENLEMGFRFNGIGSNDNLMISLIDMLLNNGKAGLIDINLMQKQAVLSAGSTILEYKDYSIHNLFGKPKKDQKLEDVENLLLKQIELLKKGEFEDWLIKAVVNDYKTKIIESYGFQYLECHRMMKSFINEVEWSEFIQKYEKMEVITKNQVMDFVKKNYNENYVVSYKRVGKDKNIVKIEKPKITKVNLNREKKSELHKELKIRQ